MLTLSIVWLLAGFIIGALALAARLPRISTGRRGWLVTLAIGAGAGLLGGWLGTLLFGRYFGSPSALWVAVVAVTLAPLLVARFTRSRPAGD